MTRPPTILLVDDDDSLRNALQYILEGAGFEVVATPTAEAALLAVAGRAIDLALLDVGLPGMDGTALARRLARLPGTDKARVVMLTGDDLEEHMVEVLETLADDYIVKPARPRVLLARLRAVLRRGPRESLAAESSLISGGITVDPSRHEAWAHGRRLLLTRTEFELLELFVRSPGKVFRRVDLIEAVHGSPTAISERSVDFCLHGLRTKLGPSGARLETVRGVGFKLAVEQPTDAPA